MNLNNINNNTLFEELKTRLEARFGQLPDFGIIAGQAVASACYDYYLTFVSVHLAVP